ncbi:unnamed protein product [Pleuronectes platessa]|uniref:Uncharacterized protein n=1 Tax=Pleuronectes platessa TaxID=8262 RepID=A0A9N7YDI6_PLEPL|nr:unnamed protein product [Pleuronectes platessa]
MERAGRTDSSWTPGCQLLIQPFYKLVTPDEVNTFTYKETGDYRPDQGLRLCQQAFLSVASSSRSPGVQSGVHIHTPPYTMPQSGHQLSHHLAIFNRNKSNLLIVLCL